MNIIVAVDKNWAIGNKSELLVLIPNDQKHIRQETAGKIVVFGRKTLATLPGGLPLHGRVNIILSTDRNLKVKGATVVHSMKVLLELLGNYKSEDIFIIGGESVYKQMLPYCDTVHITRIDHAYDADTYFPNLDELSDWKVTADSEEQTYFDLEYQFVKYQKTR